MFTFLIDGLCFLFLALNPLDLFDDFLDDAPPVASSSALPAILPGPSTAPPPSPVPYRALTPLPPRRKPSNTPRAPPSNFNTPLLIPPGEPVPETPLPKRKWRRSSFKAPATPPPQGRSSFCVSLSFLNFFISQILIIRIL